MPTIVSLGTRLPVSFEAFVVADDNPQRPGGVNGVDEQLIPTSTRCKLPRDLSHPVGAREITRALATCPQRPELTIGFLDLNSGFLDAYTARASWFWDYRSRLERGDPVRVVTVSVRCQCKGVSVSRKWIGRRWDISVLPVLREQRHVAHRLLLDEGLGLLNDWLRIATYPVRESVWHGWSA